MLIKRNDNGLRKRGDTRKVTSIYSANQQINVQLLDPRVLRLSVLWCLGRYTPDSFREQCHCVGNR